jgi:hypothetical protein
MREIANSSARSAIATHRKRRSVESTVGKAVVAIIAFVAGASLMLTAPTVRDWQFGAGIAVGMFGAVTAIFTMRLARLAAAGRVAELKAHESVRDSAADAI